jgi:hypothetical protein
MHRNGTQPSQRSYFEEGIIICECYFKQVDNECTVRSYVLSLYISRSISLRRPNLIVAVHHLQCGVGTLVT